MMFLYRDEVYNPKSATAGTAEVLVSKHRSGPTGMVPPGLARPLHPLRQHGPRVRLSVEPEHRRARAAYRSIA